MDRRAFAPYNHLSSLPEYSQVRKKATLASDITPPLQPNNGMVMHPFGNSYGPPYSDVKMDDKNLESSFISKPTTLRPFSSEAKKEHSMSYNDLYSDFGNEWSGNDALNRAHMSASAAGYTLPPTPAGAPGKYFRSLDNEAFSHVDLPKPPGQNWSLSNAAASDFPEFPSTKETEIH